jgi:hypothetical protein
MVRKGSYAFEEEDDWYMKNFDCELFQCFVKRRKVWGERECLANIGKILLKMVFCLNQYKGRAYGMNNCSIVKMNFCKN